MSDLTRARIEQRLSADLGPPRIAGDWDLNPGQHDMVRTTPFRPAAVLMGFLERPDGLTLLLTKRTEQLKRHAGQVAFPGGMRDAEDKTPIHTALREAEEEVGLHAGLTHLVTSLPSYRTATGFEVTPVVSFIAPDFKPKPDPGEVAEVFEVPLAHVLDPASHRLQSRLWKGLNRHFYSIEGGPHTIWGATAAMLVNLSAYLHDDG